MINVRDFGATGDGVTDDTQAIQSCLKSGKTAYLPAGRYLVSQLVIPAACQFIGDGDEQTIISPISDSDKPLITDDGNAQKIRIRDIGFFGEYKRLPGLIQLGFGNHQWGSRGLIQDCSIRDCLTGYGVRVDQNVAYIRDSFIRHCNVGVEARGHLLHMDRVEFMRCPEIRIYCVAIINDLHVEAPNGKSALNVHRKTILRSPSFALSQNIDCLVEHEQDNVAIHDLLVTTKPNVEYQQISKLSPRSTW